MNSKLGIAALTLAGLVGCTENPTHQTGTIDEIVGTWQAVTNIDSVYDSTRIEIFERGKFQKNSVIIDAEGYTIKTFEYGEWSRTPDSVAFNIDSSWATMNKDATRYTLLSRFDQNFGYFVSSDILGITFIALDLGVDTMRFVRSK